MAPKTHHFNDRQYMRTDTYEIFRYRDSYLKEVALHHHDFYEIYFFVSGNVQYNIESRTYSLTSGDILLISPMELHQPVFDQNQGTYERIVLWIDKRFLNALNPGEDLSRCFDTSVPNHTNMLRPDGALRQILTYQLEQLILETESDQAHSELLALTYLAQVLIHLNRHAMQKNPISEPREVTNVVYRVLAYINEHYSEDLTLDFLANKFFISKYHLSREFVRLIGTSVHRYIIQKRLVMAKQMMSEGISLALVYQNCGFGDYSNFYRAFKAEYQISPKEFIAQLKKAELQNEERSRLFRELAEK